MSQGKDFELESDDIEPTGDVPEAPASAGAPAPIVVVQYRDRWVHPALIPPLLILLLVTGGLALHRQRAVARRGGDGDARPGTAASEAAHGPGRVIMVESPSTGASYEPIVLRDQAALPTAADAKPEEEPEPAGVLAVEGSLPPPVRPTAEARQAAPAGAAPAPGPGAAPAAPPLLDATAKAGRVAPPAPPLAAATKAPTPPSKPAAFDLDARDEQPSSKPAPEDEAAADIPTPSDADVNLVANPPKAGAPPAIGFVPPSEGQPPGVDGPPPKKTKEEFEAEVRREAQEKQAEIRAIEEARPQSLLQELADAIAKAEADRGPFLEELKQILEARAKKTGVVIERLCDQHGRDTLPEIRAYVTRAVKLAPPRSTQQDRVALMRQFGMPEPMILDFLSHEVERRLLNSRNGPRNQDEVRTFAARQLLAMPLAKRKPNQAEQAAKIILKFLASRPKALGSRTARRP